jgi:hypothetical protein
MSIKIKNLKITQADSIQCHVQATAIVRDDYYNHGGTITVPLDYYLDRDGGGDNPEFLYNTAAEEYILSEVKKFFKNNK